MSGWGCPHELNEQCKRLKRPCRPGLKGCILYGKVTLREEEPAPEKAGPHGERVGRPQT